LGDDATDQLGAILGGCANTTGTATNTWDPSHCGGYGSTSENTVSGGVGNTSDGSSSSQLGGSDRTIGTTRGVQVGGTGFTPETCGLGAVTRPRPARQLGALFEHIVINRLDASLKAHLTFT